MVGKATLFVVAGFSLIFLVVEYNMGNVSTRAVQNFTEYYLENYSREIAVSGINLAANEIFINSSWRAGFTNYDFKENGKEGKLTVKVVESDTNNNHLKITSIGEYQGVKDTVEVKLVPSSFSKFAYYSESEGSNIWWTSNDTVFGPFHTQDKMRIMGTPTFYGKVTNKNGIEKKDAGSNANFLGGYQTGVDLSIPWDGMLKLGVEAGKAGKTITGKDTVYMTFAVDSIKIKYSFNGAETSYLASSYAPNGVIVVVDGILRVKGKVKGKYTIASSKIFKGGDVYLDDDIIYNTNPRTNPGSKDMLGICASRDIVIANNKANVVDNDINIDAALFAQGGSFRAQNHDAIPICGNINLYGGIVNKSRGGVGTRYSDGTKKSGFYKYYMYDERLLLDFPPAFPNTGGFEIVSWYE